MLRMEKSRGDRLLGHSFASTREDAGNRRPPGCAAPRQSGGLSDSVTRSGILDRIELWSLDRRAAAWERNDSSRMVHEGLRNVRGICRGRHPKPVGSVGVAV